MYFVKRMAWGLKDLTRGRGWTRVLYLRDRRFNLIWTPASARRSHVRPVSSQLPLVTRASMWFMFVHGGAQQNVVTRFLCWWTVAGMVATFTGPEPNGYLNSVALEALRVRHRGTQDVQHRWIPEQLSPSSCANDAREGRSTDTQYCTFLPVTFNSQHASKMLQNAFLRVPYTKCIKLTYNGEAVCLRVVLSPKIIMDLEESNFR
jgi:hypothetical protein